MSRAAIGRGDTIVEVGPGRGALTELLAPRCARLLAVELDPELCRALSRRCVGSAALRVVEADFHAFALPRGRYKVFANPPFRGSAAIVRRLLEAENPPDDAWLVLQREAALRFSGQPWARESLTSLLAKPWWHAEIVDRIEPDAFDPAPAVSCSLLWLARRGRALVSREQAGDYRAFVTALFGRRGQTLGTSLRIAFTRAQALRVARDLGFDLAMAPSTLGFEQWLALYRAFAFHASPVARAQVRAAAIRPRVPQPSRRQPC